MIIIAWVIALVLSLTLLPTFFSAVSYNIANTNLGGSNNSESQLAQNILNSEFPSSNNSGGNSIILVIQTHGGSVYSGEIRKSILALNKSLTSDPSEVNYTGISSIYSTEQSLLNSTVPGFLSQVNVLTSNITAIGASLKTLEQNLSSLNSNIFLLKSGINQTSSLIYGIPAGFVQAWSFFVTNQGESYAKADLSANQTIYPQVEAGGSESIGYYSLFYSSWNSTFSRLPNSTPLLQRESMAVGNATTELLKNPLLPNSTKELISTISTGLNVTNWNESAAITNLTISSISSEIPSSLSSSLGTSPQSLITDVYELGPNASTSSLSALSIRLISAGFPKVGFSGFSGLINETSALGPSPSKSAIWRLASEFFANATQASFSSTPLFTINATSLGSLLIGLENSTSSGIGPAISNLISTANISDYPLVLGNSITKNFASEDNGTMIVLFNYSSQPDSQMISGFREQIKNSNISTLATTYVTGGTVLSQDLQDAFTPALGVTIVPGIIISILIVGLLFLAPLAAIIPLLIGGLSIGIAYAAIYLGVVVLGRGQITFLTPTLTTLLMLGLAVDYSVLQLRRTREERTNGKPKEESVATSVRWAGEAVITAGITVIVAYIVMAVANVPLFSDVGTAIALGVSVLLLASITLLPALELSLGDKLFWPGLRQRGSFASVKRKRSMLEKISGGTSKHKVPVAILITLFAIGAVYVTVSTPTGTDLLKLIPNFQSNEGLTVITNSLGSATIAPTVILVTTPTPIVYRNNQFNETLLNELESISSAAASSQGVVSVTGPTRPYGSTFNYSSVQNFSEPLHTQYLTGMLSQIGKDNKTALISVGLSSGSESAGAVNSLLQLEKKINALTTSNGVSIFYGGATQQTFDSESFINGILPEVIIILAAAVFVILLLQLRSVFTPLRLVFTILCSVAFSLALLSITFFFALGLPILDFAPLFVVVTMLGVGIDYDIFFVTRIREEVLGGKSDNEAIKTATMKIWVTILGLGLVLACVFGSLLVTGIALLQEISLAVSAAVLIDVGVVILLFVPSLMGLAQRFNWWPSRIGRNPAKVSETE